MQFDIPKNFGLGLFARRLVQYGAGRYLEDEGDEGLRKIPITLFWWPALRASLMPFLPQATAFVSQGRRATTLGMQHYEIANWSPRGGNDSLSLTVVNSIVLSRAEVRLEARFH
jgi:hypothetical protein